MVTRAPRQGDWRGLSELRKDVKRTLARSCRDESELEDMVQETLLRAATFRPSLHDRERLRPWVLRIAWNVMRDHVRREQRLRRTDACEEILAELVAAEPESALSEISLGDGSMDADELLEVLRGLLSGLSEVEQQLYAAYYGDGLGCRQAALILDVSTQTVKMRLFRLRRKLQRGLQREARRRAHLGGGGELVRQGAVA